MSVGENIGKHTSILGPEKTAALALLAVQLDELDSQERAALLELLDPETQDFFMHGLTEIMGVDLFDEGGAKAELSEAVKKLHKPEGNLLFEDPAAGAQEGEVNRLSPGPRAGAVRVADGLKIIQAGGPIIQSVED